ncbi:helix-turn-helix transcriptional regulator [Trichococcus pasteurii]|uniref:HTH cro/C1-type domain-containing protein n=1 Tax=Trichococcus pasteurii TaxID=43064 RepID=A0A1W1IDD3_9LACT|nr:helix-turn-helix domain-containing protein [Trichococcus pasteurii]SFE36784.1 DNA-binding transcriptional regulator, XRE-family HTH domain [Trichococcus pasteurii]SLM50879.1 Hypothetical protein TPAS_551 [Trichococcus pasteurii]SSB91760.1 Hypothetical protein TPAS_551 [Trichococcus pasteurii]
MLKAVAKTKVRGYRVMLGKTQQEMADLFNISKQSYSAKERGVTRFSEDEMITLKEMLQGLFPGITIDEIFLVKK